MKRRRWVGVLLLKFNNFVSALNNYYGMKRITGRIEEIRKRMDSLVRNFPGYLDRSFPELGSLEIGMTRKRGDLNSSFVLQKDIIGRNLDRKAVIEMLLLDHQPDAVSVVSLVGMGGLGKTTLARLIYDDEEVKKHFSVRMWACVSDVFDLRAIVSMLLGSMTQEPPNDHLQLNQLQSCLHSQIKGRKYLIVLDDVWTEDYQHWLDLKYALLVGTAEGQGGRLLVTTRSRVVPQVIQSGLVYELKPLSYDQALCLFKSVAFRGEEPTDDYLAKAGEAIVRKCGGLPLAVRTIAGLLYGQSKSKWLSVKDAHLADIREYKESVMSVLKHSYDHLPSPLKMCFTYVALFPKDYVIEKKRLIAMWMAQGFIHPKDPQTLEDLGHDYFMDLLRRHFFQAAKLDNYGKVVSFKMHDLIHDFALQVAKEEVVVVASSVPSSPSEQARHFAVIDANADISSIDTYLASPKQIRTVIIHSYPNTSHPLLINSSISKLRSLRALDLHHSYIRELPSSLGKLLHLRYLDLSSNFELQELPSSITRLCNLETLLLRECRALRHLPQDFNRLVNLRHLDLYGCNRLTHMPLKMGQLTGLRTLTMFTLGGENCASGTQQLEDLKSLRYIEGSLLLRVLTCWQEDVGKSKEAGYLKTKPKLEELCIQWKINDKALDQRGNVDCDAALLDDLEPPVSCKSFELIAYPGTRFPSWQILAAFPNLVSLRLEQCTRLRHLPSIGRLPPLKVLEINGLVNLEYVEDSSEYHASSQSGSGATVPLNFFPSLEMLTLRRLPKLKVWWSEVRMGDRVERGDRLLDRVSDKLLVPSFPRLSYLRIGECPNLISLPRCPNLKELDMCTFNEALPSSFITSSASQQQHCLRKVRIDNVGYLNSMSVGLCQQLSHLVINLSDEESLSRSKEVFRSSMPRLESLQISLCSKLKDLSGLGWEHLTALKRLCLSNLPVLHLATADGMPWRSLHNLMVLELDYLPKLVNLPDGIQYLTNLRALKIRSCHCLRTLPDWIGDLTQLQSLCIEACIGLERLPESMSHLTSLSNLEILRCSGCLRERCQQLTGMDWPKIQHIPRVFLL